MTSLGHHRRHFPGQGVVYTFEGSEGGIGFPPRGPRATRPAPLAEGAKGRSGGQRAGLVARGEENPYLPKRSSEVYHSFSLSLVLLLGKNNNLFFIPPPTVSVEV